jgi:hypothetical protein
VGLLSLTFPDKTIIGKEAFFVNLGIKSYSGAKNRPELDFIEPFLFGLKRLGKRRRTS